MKREGKKEQSIQKLWDNIKQFIIHATGISEGQKKKNEAEEMLVDILAKNFF